MNDGAELMTELPHKNDVRDRWTEAKTEKKSIQIWLSGRWKTT